MRYGREIRCEWTAKPTVEPAQEPLSIDDAKLHCAIAQDDDNGLIDAFIRAAREAAEAYLSRALFTQTRVVTYSQFADEMWLPFAAPLQSVSSVQYYDVNGVQQTLASSYYTVLTNSEPGRIVRAANQSWPSVQPDRLMPITITYVCGQSDLALIPEAVKLGMRLHIAASDGDRMNPNYAAAEALWERAGRVYWREPVACHV